MAEGRHHRLLPNVGDVRGILRAADVLQRRTIAWASQVLSLLPKRLPLTDAEKELLKLFLAQQRRLNLELDGRQGFLAGPGRGRQRGPQAGGFLHRAGH